MSSFDMLEWVDANLTHAKPSAKQEWTAECPFCSEYGGFYVNCDPEGQGPWVCFKCNERSLTIVRLVAHVEGIDAAQARALVMSKTVNFRRRETITSLRDRIAAVRQPEAELNPDWLDEVVEELPPGFTSVWDGSNWSVPVYLVDRKFKRETLREWGVGFCEFGRYGGRVIIPIDCPNGRSFTARDLTGKQIPRYLNPTGADHGKLLFGWNQAPMEGDFTLAEGPFDAMKLHQHGIPAMAVGGKVLHEDQLAMLFRRPADVAVTVMFDPEAKADAFAAAAELVARFKMVYVASLPAGIDPGDSTKRQAAKAHSEAEQYSGERHLKIQAALFKASAKLQRKYGV